MPEPDDTDTTRRPWVVPAVLSGIAVIGIALALFQPWRLVIDNRVDDAAPVVATGRPAGPATPTTTTATSNPAGASPSTTGPTATGPSATGPSGASPSTILAPVERGGTFVSKAHGTDGRARLIDTGAGHVLRLEDLDTDNGPDVIVVLSTADPADPGIGTDYLDLGPMKGNQGNQNYEVPAGTDVSRFTTATLWCRRFSVAFGTAPLV